MNEHRGYVRNLSISKKTFLVFYGLRARDKLACNVVIFMAPASTSWAEP